MDLGLADRVVLITGGSGGIGGPVAHVFAEENARVAIAYRRNPDAARKVADQVEQNGGKALVVPYELTDPAAIRAAVETITQEWGGVDVLVHSASPAGGPSLAPVPFEELSIETWRPQVRAEVEGAFATAQAVLPSMKERGWGRFVFLSAAIVGRGRTGDEAYVASKMALHGLSRTLATEALGHGILSNVVAPGPTVTEGYLRWAPEDLRRRIEGMPPEEIREQMAGLSPHVRISTPREVAAAIVFLASAANGNITGSVIHVSGGS
ncbi:SDR family NAD(P)-dependent oxidoreductase [Actinoallomurus iriomotensis]|uniref:3-ketoacyl-ACP reductase n=1 Tax=Actinoallomurus iriomotensis TaxID=478107 RepID=A0A9W6VP92_9ACTN|nr:SDR family oxidoreductase [Actinoallomurus iriomotensis]GLY75485.1 3-ketoacyl-ACP reductase [Actinoallomurus iriomotensis]